MKETYKELSERLNILAERISTCDDLRTMDYLQSEFAETHRKMYLMEQSVPTFHSSIGWETGKAALTNDVPLIIRNGGISNIDLNKIGWTPEIIDEVHVMD